MSSLPTVYIIDGSIAITGAFVCARNMAHALSGTARVVLVLPDSSAIGPEDTAPFAAVHRLPIRHLGRRVRAVIEYVPALVLVSVQLRRLMRSDGASVLILNDFYNMHGAVCRLLGYRGKVLTWVRIAPGALGARISALWLWAAAVSSDSVIAVSRHIQRLLPHAMHTELLYDAVDPAPRMQSIDASSRRFVYIGNYIAGKGQELAVDAFAAIADEFPDMSLHFYGGDMGLPRNRAYREALAGQVRDRGLEQRIFLHGFARDPGDALQGARAALNFSASEAFSMTVLEAQAAGVPVIAARSGGPEEIVADRETGFLVPVGDVVAMASAMRTLAANSKRASDMGLAARARASALFSPAAFREALLAVVDIQAPDAKDR